MNVYDFDKTIFYPDSSACFFRYCLKRRPGQVLRVLPRALLMALQYRAGKRSAKELKQQLFSFLSHVRDAGALINDFWVKNFFRIGDWYLIQKRPDDVIISASPDFLLRPVCEKLGVRLIATDMDIQSGMIRGENCHDVEKPKRFKREYPEALVEAFYSDSLSDAPMAALAESAFLVKKHRLYPWPGR